MRFLTHSIAAGAMIASGSMVQAGGLSPEITEAPVMMTQEPAPAGSSISPTYVVLGVLAALLIAAAVADDDDEGDGDNGGDSDDLGAALSDARLKTNITQIGTAENGLPVYSYRYLGHDALFSGVMAQDVLAHTPEAVVTMPGGFYAVNYDMLGMRMERLD